MSNTINSDLFFFLLALIVSALLGFLIGWLMKSMKINVLKESLDTCIKNNEDLKNQIKSDSNYKDFNNQISVLKKTPELDKKVDLSDNKELKVASTYKPTSPNKSSSEFIKEDVKKTLGKSIKENDLKVVEGIGPKIEEILNKDGIKTWKQLSNAPVSRLQKILNEADEKFLFHKPDTWPTQSLLAAEGKWEELKKLQDDLDGGKELS